MLRRNSVAIIVTIAVLFTAFIYLYPLISFQNISTQSVTSEIELFKSNNHLATMTTNYDGIQNHYLLQISETHKDVNKHKVEHIFENKDNQPVSYEIINSTAKIQPFIFGVVNDDAIKSLYYDDHVGANGVISFLDEGNSFQNSGRSSVTEHPQPFIIKTPFTKGTLIAKDENNNIIFEQAINVDR